MPLQLINTGTLANDGTGDTLRMAGQKMNANATELFDAVGALAGGGAAPVQSVAGKTGVVTLAKADVGLGAVDNTADADKPIGADTQAALDLKADTTAIAAAIAAAQPLKCVLSHIVGPNISGGSSTSGSNFRVLNTRTGNTSFATITSATTFTLNAGTYEVDWRAPAAESDQHVAFLENLSDGIQYFGGTAFNSVNSANQNDSAGTAAFTITATKTYRIHHLITAAKGSDGLGLTYPGAAVNVYTQVKIAKLA